MKKLFGVSLAVAFLATGLQANGGKVSEPMKRLQKAFTLIEQGQNAKAVEHLTWCYDKGVEMEPAFLAVRNTYVIDTLAILGKTYPPAKEVLVARRDAAMARVGSPPTISLHLFDALALNRALGDTQKNKELLRKCGHEASIKKFASTIESATGSREPVGDLQQYVGSAETLERAQTTAVLAELEATRLAVQEIGGEIELMTKELERQRVRLTEVQAALSATLEELPDATAEELERRMAQATVQTYEVERVQAEILELESTLNKLQQKQAEAQAKLAMLEAELARISG